MSLEEKSKLALQLVKEIVEEATDRDAQIGGLMRTFGDDYVRRIETISNFFKGV